MSRHSPFIARQETCASKAVTIASTRYACSFSFAGMRGRSGKGGAGILTELGDTALLNAQTAEMREACAKAGVPPFDE